jgi:tRNA A58 N-methylase Trm61
MKTRSIYQGFLVHITVAALMDWLALRHRHATPVDFWPKDTVIIPDPAASDAMARQIELVAGSGALLIVAGVIMVIALRRFVADRSARAAVP